VLIIGGGFGGMQAARTLAGRDVDITIIDRHNHHVFQPLLYQVATAGLSPGEIASPIRWILRRQRNVTVLLGEVESVDRDRRLVRLSPGTSLPYDFLIVAAGATHAYFGHDDWRANAPGLKTLEDALHIRRRVLLAFEEAERCACDPERGDPEGLLTFVIVGGGPTGVELAGALAEIARHTMRHDFRRIDPSRAAIVLVEGGPRLLSAFSEGQSRFAHAALEQLGVRQRGRQRGRDHSRVRRIGIAAHVAHRSVGGGRGGLAAGRGRLVACRSRRPGAGAARPHDSPGVAQVAMQQGARAARNIICRIAGRPMQPFRYRNYGNMATIGRAKAVADFGWLKMQGFIAWLAWLFIHVAKLIGFRNRLSVMLQWAWAYLSYQRGARLITDEEAGR
jgi:NADH dehydrogenase